MRKNKYALVADDDVDICKFVSEDLLSLKYFRRIILGHDGAEAKRKVLNQDFDLFVLDLQMPKLDGIGLTKFLVEMVEVDPRKIVLISGNVKTENVISACHWNVRNIILKPFTREYFIGRVKDILEI